MSSCFLLRKEECEVKIKGQWQVHSNTQSLNANDIYKHLKGGRQEGKESSFIPFFKIQRESRAQKRLSLFQLLQLALSLLT